MDFIKKNNGVCFEVKEWKGDGMSVICYGEVALRDDFEAKKKCCELLANQETPESQIQNLNVTIGIIEIEEMTGRRHEPGEG